MLPKLFHVIAIALGLVSFSAGDYARYEQHVRQLAQNETFVKMFDEHVKLYQDNNHNQLKAGITPFTCDKSVWAAMPCSPKSVHELMPTDIKVVGALGDSITAGTGITASTVLGLLRQDRGLSWSIGGDESIETEETLPNMLRKYNPDVKGYSTGWGPVWMKSVSKFNLADPGDKSEDIIGQANELITRMTEDSSVDFIEDWKMITIFIGGNDLCDYCGSGKEKYSAENYVNNVKAALDILHQNVPKAFVNVVPVLDIAIVKKLNANLVCDALHLYGCSCAAFPWNSEAEQELQAETKRYQALTHDLIESGRYDTRDDFTVVEQPFFTETMPPDTAEGKPDLSYFSPDCFHLSLKGHRAAAEALWNNMVEPCGKKRTKWSPGEQFECPTQDAPYFYTKKNSAGQQPNSRAGCDGQLGSGSQQQQQSVDGLGSSFMQQVPQQNQAGDQQTGNEESGSHTGLIISASVGLGLMAVVAAVIIAVKRRRRSKEEEEFLIMDKWTVKNYA